MTVDFRELEALALQNLDLLEEAAQTYVIVAPTLPSCLQNRARKEISFFLELYLDSLTRTTQNPQPPENMLILKLPDDQARFARDGRSWGYLVSPLTL